MTPTLPELVTALKESDADIRILDFGGDIQIDTPRLNTEITPLLAGMGYALAASPEFGHRTWQPTHDAETLDDMIEVLQTAGYTLSYNGEPVADEWGEY